MRVCVALRQSAQIEGAGAVRRGQSGSFHGFRLIPVAFINKPKY